MDFEVSGFGSEHFSKPKHFEVEPVFDRTRPQSHAFRAGIELCLYACVRVYIA